MADFEDIGEPFPCIATGCSNDALYCSAPCAISDAMSRDEALVAARLLIEKFKFTNADLSPL